MTPEQLTGTKPLPLHPPDALSQRWLDLLATSEAIPMTR